MYHNRGNTERAKQTENNWLTFWMINYSHNHVVQVECAAAEKLFNDPTLNITIPKGLLFSQNCCIQNLVFIEIHLK